MWTGLVQIGVENSSEEVLRASRKSMDLRTLVNTFQVIKEHGIRTKGFFILGHFQETRTSIEQTVDMALALDPSWVFFSPMVPLPGTALYETAREKGYLETSDWDRFNYHGRAIIHTENFTSRDLDRMRRRAYLRFYLRPRKVLSFARDAILSGDCRSLWTNFLAFLDTDSVTR